jgi:hypothetical protein
MPVEVAMDAIAQAANATWRRVYVMRVDTMPQTLLARKPEADPKENEKQPKERPKPGPRLFSSHASLTGQPTKFAIRDRFKINKSYAQGVRPVLQDLAQLEKHAMLGIYGNFFLFDSDDGREAAMNKFMAGLQSQLKRLEALPANQRVVTTMQTRRNFERLVEDFANLDKDQKKQAQKIYDFAKEQLQQPPLKP